MIDWNLQKEADVRQLLTKRTSPKQRPPTESPTPRRQPTMGRSKPTPIYKPQSKTAHIKRVPSFEPPAYEHAVEQQLIRNAYSNQPGHNAWTGVNPQQTNYINQQHCNGATFVGVNDQPMDIVYPPGDSGFVGYPMVISSPSVDLMDVDIPEEDLMNVDDPNEMDIDHSMFYENITPQAQALQCHPIVQTNPTHLSRPELALKPIVNATRKIAPLKPPQRSLPAHQRPVLAPIHNVPPQRNVPQGSAQPFRVINAPPAQAIAVPPPSGTHSGLSPTDDLEQVIQGLLKLNLSVSDIPPTVQSSATGPSSLSVVDNTSPCTELNTTELNTETLVSLSDADVEVTQSTSLPPALPSKGVWADLAGLEDAFTAPKVNTRASIDIVTLSLSSPKTITDFFELPNVNWEPAFKANAYEQPLKINKGSPSKKYPSQKVKNLSKNAIFREKSHSTKSLLLGSSSEPSQTPRKNRVSAINEMTHKGFTAHMSSSNFSLRKALAKFRFDEAHRAALLSPVVNNAVVPVREKPPVSYTDRSARTSYLPSYNMVPRQPHVAKVSVPPKPVLRALPIVPRRDRIIQEILESYVWVESALEISKACPPEPQVVKTTSGSITAETYVPGDFLGSQEKAWWHPRRKNPFSWFSLRILGW